MFIYLNQEKESDEDSFDSYEDYGQSLYPLEESFITPTELKMKRKLTQKELRYYTAVKPTMRRKYILDYFEDYKAEFEKLLSVLKNNQFFQRKSVFQIFMLLAKLNCLYHRDGTYFNVSESDMYFCIVNDTMFMMF